MQAGYSQHRSVRGNAPALGQTKSRERRDCSHIAPGRAVFRNEVAQDNRLAQSRKEQVASVNNYCLLLASLEARFALELALPLAAACELGLLGLAGATTNLLDCSALSTPCNQSHTIVSMRESQFLPNRATKGDPAKWYAAAACNCRMKKSSMTFPVSIMLHTQARLCVKHDADWKRHA